MSRLGAVRPARGGAAVWRVLAALVILLAVAAWYRYGGAIGTPSAPEEPVPLPGSATAATAELATIRVHAIPGRDPSYERDAFGDPWSDRGIGIADAGNGCDTRNDVLRRDAKPGTLRFKAGGTCAVSGGTWISPYNGAKLTRTSVIDIDHVVPLGRAWSAGAKSWVAQRRLNFANDPDNLLAADASSNRSKGDLGPAAWRPVVQGQCSYAAKYIHATRKYGLPLAAADVTALREMLGTCSAA
jgi:hypothetical protein